MDNQEFTFLILLDRGATFDTMNHSLMMDIQKRMSPCSAFIFREKEELAEIKRNLKRCCNLKLKHKQKRTSVLNAPNISFYFFRVKNKRNKLGLFLGFENCKEA